MSHDWMTRARAEGLIGPEADLTPPRPWPVVVLTGLAAWLAVPPLVFALYLLFGQGWSQGPMDYVVGLLLVALAIVLLRGRGRALFLEQLGVPLLLTGLMSLAHGLDRSLTDLQAEAVGLLITVGLIMALPASWLRQLLGAAAAVLTTLLMWHLAPHRIESPRTLWALGHLLGLIALLLVGAQRQMGRDAKEAGVAAVLEPVLAGWWVVALGLLVWSAGPTFLVAGALVDVLRNGAPPAVAGTDWTGVGISAVSALLVLAAAWTGWRAWAPVQPWRLVPPVLVLAGLAMQMPALGGCLALMMLMLVTRRWRLALLAAAAVLWVLGSCYYDLRMPLQDKALVLVVAGALLAGWAWGMARPVQAEGAVVDANLVQSADGTGSGTAANSHGAVTQRRAQADAGATAAPATEGEVTHAVRQVTGAAWWLLAFGVLAIGLVNVLIQQKEQLIRDGRPVFVRLGPVDPRSLMQGDYMRLSFTLPGTTRLGPSDRTRWGRRPIVAARLDERGIVQSPRLLDPGEAVPAGMVPLQLAPTRSGWTFVTDAWFFPEGEGSRWAAARYGEFRLMPDGRALLVNLVGEDLKPL